MFKIFYNIYRKVKKETLQTSTNGSNWIWMFFSKATNTLFEYLLSLHYFGGLNF